jgi:hypothetical protein
MPGSVRHRWLTLAIGVALLLCPVARAQSVLTYHGSPNRNGTYVIPRLTWERARGIHLDTSFDGHIDGHIYTQPLFWQSSKDHRQLLLVASGNDVVYALDAPSGQVVWRKSLGRPVSGSALPCGNISPLGITGTPVIDNAHSRLP